MHSNIILSLMILKLETISFEWPVKAFKFVFPFPDSIGVLV
jgi:hypothetical protein